MVTCDRGDAAAVGNILANGIVLEDKAEDTPDLGESGIIQRYWIDI